MFSTTSFYNRLFAPCAPFCFICLCTVCIGILCSVQLSHLCLHVRKVGECMCVGGAEVEGEGGGGGGGRLMAALTEHTTLSLSDKAEDKITRAEQQCVCM